MSPDTELLPSGDHEVEDVLINSGARNDIEGVTEIESLCMRCHDNVRQQHPLALIYS